MYETSGVAKRVYERNKDKFDTTDKGEYFVNIGLFNNAEIGQTRSIVIPLAKEIKFIAVETLSTDRNNIDSRKQINQMIVELKKNFMILMGQTSGQLERMGAKEYTDAIKKGYEFERIPVSDIPVIQYADYAIEYCNILVRTGITPIVAGYEDSSGFNKMGR